jgi:hypothetical protein
VPSLLLGLAEDHSLVLLMCKGASLAENAPSDKQVAEVREGVCVYMFRVQGTIRHRRGTLLSVESSTQSYAQLHVFDVDIET